MQLRLKPLDVMHSLLPLSRRYFTFKVFYFIKPLNKSFYQTYTIDYLFQNTGNVRMQASKRYLTICGGDKN